MIENKELRFLARLDRGNMNINLAKDIYDYYKPIKANLEKKYSNYLSKNLDIQRRHFSDPNKVNNKLNFDYRKSIVDQSVGYILGKAINFVINDPKITNSTNKYNENQLFSVSNEINSFMIKNNFQKSLIKVCKDAGIMGFGAIWVYVDKETAEFKTMPLSSYNCFSLGSNSEGTYRHGFIFEEAYNAQGVQYVKCTYSNEKYIEVYNIFSSGAKRESKVFHYFGVNPLIIVKNNMEMQNDFDNVDSLINAVDKLMSDAQNESEEQRLAYIVLQGKENITQEVVERARQTGVFKIPEDAKMYYLTKDINPAIISEHYDKLNENIWKLSNSVDFTDQKFSEASGEARKWKLINLENKSTLKIVELKASLRTMFKAYMNVLRFSNLPNVDYFDIQFVLTRALPVDLTYVADYINKLAPHVSRETLMSLMPFVENPSEEIAKIDGEEPSTPEEIEE